MRKARGSLCSVSCTARALVKVLVRNATRCRMHAAPGLISERQAQAFARADFHAHMPMDSKISGNSEHHRSMIEVWGSEHLKIYIKYPQPYTPPTSHHLQNVVPSRPPLLSQARSSHPSSHHAQVADLPPPRAPPRNSAKKQERKEGGMSLCYIHRRSNTSCCCDRKSSRFGLHLLWRAWLLLSLFGTTCFCSPTGLSNPLLRSKLLRNRSQRYLTTTLTNTLSMGILSPLAFSVLRAAAFTGILRSSDP